MDALLEQVAMPLSLSLWLVLVALLLSGLRRRQAAILLTCMAGCWLWIWSTPAVSSWARDYWEGPAMPLAASSHPEADAIVLLGGGIDAAPAAWPLPRLNPSADRVWYAAQLLHAERAPWVVATGGAVRGPDWVTEAEVMRDFLRDLGVPEQAIRLEGQSANTYENALNSRAILEAIGAERVLLVTSALHMRRAKGVFEKAGIRVSPAATTFDVLPPRRSWRAWLPSASALHQSSGVFREILAYAVYRARGWI